MAFVYEHRVRASEVDIQGFVFNSRFLEMVDDAFTEYFRDLGYPYLELIELGFNPSVAQVTIRYATPARFEDLLQLHVSCTRVGTSSFEFAVDFRRDDDLVAEARLVYVNVDVASARVVALPEEIATLLRGLAPEPQG